MADATANVGIVINGEDKSGPAFQSASKGAERLASRMSTVKDGLQKLPDAAGKASGALLLLQTSTAQMGGKVADVVNKIGALAALMAVGGPLGLALGAIAAAVAGVSWVLEKLNADSRIAAEGQKILGEAIADIEKDAKAAKDAMASVGDQLLAIGRSAIDAKIIQLRFDLIDARIALEDLEAAGADTGLQIAQAEKVSAIQDQIKAVRDLKEAQEAQRRSEEAADSGPGIELSGSLGGDFLAEELKRRQDAVDAFSKFRIEQAQRQSDAELAEARRLDAELTVIENEKRARAMHTAQVIESLSNSLTTALISNDEDVRKSAISAALDIAQREIVAAAAAGAAKAFEKAQSLPFPLGLIAGPIAGAAVLAAIMAFRSQIKLAQGGTVVGGIPGKDSVNVLLEPGEEVIPKHRAGQSGGNVNVSVGVQAMDLSSISDVQLMRVGRRLGNVIEKKLKPRGMV